MCSSPKLGVPCCRKPTFLIFRRVGFFVTKIEIPALLFHLSALYRLWNKNYIKEVPNDPENELYGGYFPPGGGLKSPKGDPRD